MKHIKLGVIGCGAISSTYLTFFRKFEFVKVVACADLNHERAKARSAEFSIPNIRSVQDILSDPEIDIILNLTTPAAHAEIALSALDAGKAVYSEKPLAITLDEGQAVIESAKKNKMSVGCAPDTFLGGGIQTCIKLINDGLIGKPIGVTACMACHGHEGWHPDPEFYYKLGGGPMFDMGPYYLTALVALIGPVKNVVGCAKKTFSERKITSKPKNGNIITVEVPTHITGILEFANDAVGTILMSFDVWASTLPHIEVYGTEGTLSVPDPNTFSGPVRVKRAEATKWSIVTPSDVYAENNRGIGVVDMASAIQCGESHRANGELGFHVLDIMTAIQESSEQGKRITLTSTCSRPAPLREKKQEKYVGL